MALLPDNEIDEQLDALPEWRREGDTIVRVYDRDDFVGAVRFIDSLVEPAEEMGHHPDLEVSWKDVTVRLTTHSQGGLTAADFELAAQIEDLA